MIWSATPFWNELDILEIRLGMLEDVVDRHVIVEANVTQNGRYRPVVWPGVAKSRRFRRWADRIDYILVSDMPRGKGHLTPNGWSGDFDREAYQRNAAMRVLSEVEVDDLVLLSDLDEIPRPEAIQHRSDLPCRLQMSMHLYYLNWRWEELPVWRGTRAVLCEGWFVKAHAPSEIVARAGGSTGEVDGWHLAYMGGIAAIQAKLFAIADDWRDRKRHFVMRDHLESCMANGADLFDREERRCIWVPDSELPPYAVANRKRFGHLFLEQPKGARVAA
jgi:beta-1,4-mannosyl-glycoprotein beta-1,4-N-acetylglucosaminyltransferase